MHVEEVEHWHQYFDGRTFKHLKGHLLGDFVEKFDSCACKHGVLNVFFHHRGRFSYEAVLHELSDHIWKDVHDKEEALQN